MLLPSDRNLILFVKQIETIIKIQLNSRGMESHVLVAGGEFEHIIEEFWTDSPRALFLVVELGRSQQGVRFARPSLAVHEEGAVDATHIGFNERWHQVLVQRILAKTLIVCLFVWPMPLIVHYDRAICIASHVARLLLSESIRPHSNRHLD